MVVSLPVTDRIETNFAPIPFYGVKRLRTRPAGRVPVTEALHRAGADTQPHAHATATISILLAGAFDEMVGGRRVRVVGTGVVVRCPGCPHSDAFGPAAARVLHLELPDDVGDAERHSLAEWCHFESLRVSLLALALRGELWHDDDAGGLARECLTEELLLEVGRCRAGTRPASSPSRPAWLKRAREILEDRFRDRVTLGEIASEVGVHRVTLAREFRRRYGSTPGAHLRHIRLERALREMAFASRSPSDAAYEAGFYDQSHLNRWLRREAGTTPGRMCAPHVMRPDRDAPVTDRST